MGDRELVMRWVRGWAQVHSMRVEDVDGWPLVHVRRPSRETEIICVDPGRPAFDVLALHAAHDPREMLTVVGRDLGPYQAPPLPPGLRVDRDDELFMTTALAPSPVPVPDGFTSRWVDDGHRASYTVDDGERVVSEGMVGVLGADAVIDAVETSPGLRRQGLGRHVIGALTIWAVDHGARTGLMAATADGAGLYRALGWDTTMAIWSLMGVRDE